MPTESPTAEKVIPKERQAWGKLPFHQEWLNQCEDSQIPRVEQVADQLSSVNTENNSDLLRALGLDVIAGMSLEHQRLALQYIYAVASTKSLQDLDISVRQNNIGLEQLLNIIGQQADKKITTATSNARVLEHLSRLYKKAPVTHFFGVAGFSRDVLNRFGIKTTGLSPEEQEDLIKDIEYHFKQRSQGDLRSEWDRQRDGTNQTSVSLQRESGLSALTAVVHRPGYISRLDEIQEFEGYRDGPGTVGHLAYQAVRQLFEELAIRAANTSVSQPDEFRGQITYSMPIISYNRTPGGIIGHRFIYQADSFDIRGRLEAVNKADPMHALITAGIIDACYPASADNGGIITSKHGYIDGSGSIRPRRFFATDLPGYYLAIQEEFITSGQDQGGSKVTVSLAYLPMAVASKLEKMPQERLPIRLNDLEWPPFNNLTQQVLTTCYSSEAKQEASK